MANSFRGAAGQRPHRRPGPVAYANIAALILSLVPSALLTAGALRTTDHHWLAWVSFIPLFAAVRSLRPSMAAMAGAFWGFCLYLFCIAGATPVIEPSLFSLTLLTVIPAVYTGLAALASRAIGFSPVMLAFGWILVEVALKPLGLHHGLLAGAQGDGVLLHWVGRMLGYVFVAFLVVCANASLLMLLSSVRISIPRIRSLAGLTDSQACLAPRVFVRATSVAMGQAYPRAPPI